MLTRFARTRLPLVSPLSARPLSTTPRLLTATPDWQTLIGGRAGVERKKAAFQSKYADAIKAKAEKEGLTKEELMERARAAEVAAAAVERGLTGAKDIGERRVREDPNVEKTPGTDERIKGEVVRPPPSAQGQGEGPKANEFTRGSKEGPVKPLNSIMDLSKASTLAPAEVATLWTTYHQSKGFLSAAIPTDVYNRMLANGKKYPMFVLPLARDDPDAPEGEQGAVEMHLLEWAFLPQPAGVIEPVPSPSTTLFTPLAEYQVRQSYAQPYLILTHYTDLSLSHNFVLMRGEVSDNVALSPTDAQVLAVRLQLFYNSPTAKGGPQEAKRADLLKTFHETPGEFKLDELVKTAWEL